MLYTCYVGLDCGVDWELSVRITTESSQYETTIRVVGRLSRRDVPELRREFESASGSVSLDLSGLISADADGVRELLMCSENGAKLCGASAYIRQLLG